MEEKRAKMHVGFITVFYFISGIWMLMQIMRKENYSGDNFLLFYRNYVYFLGWVTLAIAFILLYRTNFSRLSALALAWWNLFTAPIFEICWVVYWYFIRENSRVISWPFFWIYTVVLIIIVSAVRIYIIYTLRISKAGYIFLKRKK